MEAARPLRLSYRQGKRYRDEGAAGLKHRSARRRPNQARPEGFRRKVPRRVRDQYGGPVRARFGPTLAAEHLAWEGELQGAAESCRGDRRWALAKELWSPDRKRRRHRRRRPRKHSAEIVQTDGSVPRWQERAPRKVA